MNSFTNNSYNIGNYYYQIINLNPGAFIISTWEYVGIVNRNCSFESCHETSGHQFKLVSPENELYSEPVFQFAEDSNNPFFDLADLAKSIIAWQAQYDTSQYSQEKIRKNFNRSLKEEDQKELNKTMSYSPSSSGGLKQFAVRTSSALAELESIKEKVDLLFLFQPSYLDLTFISKNRMVEGIQFLKNFDSIDTVRPLYGNLDIKSLCIPYMQHLPEEFSDWLSSLNSLEFLELNSNNVDDELNQCLSNFPHLLSLNLRNTCVTNEIGIGLQACPQLTVLNLENTRIDDNLFQYDLDWHRLDDLELGLTCITDNGLHKIKNFKNLRSLSLEHAAITDKSIPDIKEMKQLVSLCLSGTKISANGLSEIISSLEKCMVYY